MITLVDCGCEARVHQDGSGVEIDYCALHAAAPEMGKLLLSAWTHVSHGGPTRGELEDVLIKAELLPRIREAR